jgi:hypothetical protein
VSARVVEVVVVAVAVVVMVVEEAVVVVPTVVVVLAAVVVVWQRMSRLVVSGVRDAGAPGQHPYPPGDHTFLQHVPLDPHEDLCASVCDQNMHHVSACMHRRVLEI